MLGEIQKSLIEIVMSPLRTLDISSRSAFIPQSSLYRLFGTIASKRSLSLPRSLARKLLSLQVPHLLRRMQLSCVMSSNLSETAFKRFFGLVLSAQ